MEQQIFNIFFKHTWIMFMAVTFLNAFVLKKRFDKYAEQQPEMEDAYRKIINGIITYGNIPWIIMMLGDISGYTNGVFDFFNPSSLNPFVLLFHFSIIVFWLISIRWIFFKNGAEFLANHPELTRKGNYSKFSYGATEIKILFVVILIGGIAAMLMMWFAGDIPASFSPR